MGDIIGIVDDSGNLIVSYAYDAWGKVLSVTGANVELGNLNPFRYRSYYYDSDIEMYYLQSRYYDPEVCRFINSDDVNFIGATGTVGSYNAFAYCENSPVNNSDPSGKALVETMIIYVLIKGVTLATTFVLSGILVLGAAKTAIDSGAAAQLTTALGNLLKVLGTGIISLIKEIKTAVNQAVKKAKNKVETSRTEEHHIIAKKAKKMEESRNIWKKDLGLSINNKRNLITLNYNLHRVLHTSLYYLSVNALIVKAYEKGEDKKQKKNNVFTALGFVKALLFAVNKK